MSMAGASGERFPKRTQALFCGGPLFPPPPLVSFPQPSQTTTVRTAKIAAANRFIALPPWVHPERPHGWALGRPSGTARKRVMFTVRRQALSSIRGVHGRAQRATVLLGFLTADRRDGQPRARKARAAAAGSGDRKTPLWTAAPW